MLGPRTTGGKRSSTTSPSRWYLWAEGAALSQSCHKTLALIAGEAQGLPRRGGEIRVLGDPGCGGHVALRGFVVLYELLNELSPGVDCEDSRLREAHLPVGKNILQETEKVGAVSETAGRREPGLPLRGVGTHIGPVPKGSVEGLSLRQKQLLDITQAGNLEHLWLLLDYLPGEWPRSQTGKRAKERQDTSESEGMLSHQSYEIAVSKCVLLPFPCV